LRPQKYTPKPNEELYGTWINKTYSGHYAPGDVHPQKELLDSAGYTVFRLTDDFAKYWTGPEQIVGRWTDSEGNIWYKTHKFNWSDGKKDVAAHLLYKLSKSATVRESVFVIRDTYNPDAFPKKIDPKDTSYTIYNRAKGVTVNLGGCDAGHPIRTDSYATLSS